MKIASLAEIKSKFSEFIKESRKGPVVITKNGKPAALLISVTSDEQMERIILSESRMLKKMLMKSKKAMGAGDKIGHQEFWDEL